MPAKDTLIGRSVSALMEDEDLSDGDVDDDDDEDYVPSHGDSDDEDEDSLPGLVERDDSDDEYEDEVLEEDVEEEDLRQMPALGQNEEGSLPVEGGVEDQVLENPRAHLLLVEDAPADE